MQIYSNGITDSRTQNFNKWRIPRLVESLKENKNIQYTGWRYIRLLYSVADFTCGTSLSNKEWLTHSKTDVTIAATNILSCRCYSLMHYQFKTTNYLKRIRRTEIDGVRNIIYTTLKYCNAATESTGIPNVACGHIVVPEAVITGRTTPSSIN